MPETLHPVHRRQAQLEHGQFDALACRQGLPQELDHRDAGDRLRVLEGEEHPRLGPLVARPVGDVVALERDGPGGDLVLGRAHQRVAERALARPVGTHHGMDLTGLDRRSIPRTISSALRRRSVQPLDAEQLGHGCASVVPARMDYHYVGRGNGPLWSGRGELVDDRLQRFHQTARRIVGAEVEAARVGEASDHHDQLAVGPQRSSHV